MSDTGRVFIVHGWLALDARRGWGPETEQFHGRSAADLIAKLDAARIPRSALFLVVPDDTAAPDVSLWREEYEALRKILGPDVQAGS